MAERVKSLLKRSGSSTNSRKGSIVHVGTTPYRFKVSIFVSYVDNVRHNSDVCLTWERRAKTEATKVVKPKDNKAVFKQGLSMEHTLFRKKAKKEGDSEMRFDEKKAKLVLRKGAPDGKAIGKINLNMAEYVKGTNSTVFADFKLSNDSIVIAKVEAILLHMGKKKKNGSQAASEACSDMTDMNSAENDSIFGDESEDTKDLEIEVSGSPSSSLQLDTQRGLTVTSSPVSDSNRISPASSAGPSSASEKNKKPPRGSDAASERGKKEELQESTSFREKLRTKLRERRSSRKIVADTNEAENSTLNDGASLRSMRRSKTRRAEAAEAELRELRLLVDSLKEENMKLRKQKQAALDQVDTLKLDLEECENALENATLGASTKAVPDARHSNAKDREISRLKAQKQHLLDELEEKHDEEVQSSSEHMATSSEILSLRKKVRELEVALQREPKYLEVVNELKVTKMSLALANMEKEQAIFALHTIRTQFNLTV